MPSPAWDFLTWEAKAPEPCEEVNPCRTCTEVWVRASASSPYEGYLGGQDIQSTVSLPPASFCSLPTRRSLQHLTGMQSWTKEEVLTAPTRRSLRAIQEPEPTETWFPSSIYEKICAVLPLSGPSTAPTKGERDQMTANHAKADVPPHGINPSVDPRQIAADDFGYSLQNADAVGSSFMIPSTLQVAQYDYLQPLGEGRAVGWQDSSVKAPRRQEGHTMHDDTDSGDETDDAWDPMPKREVSSNALARLEVSLRHALDSASPMGRTELRSAGRGRVDGQARPSMTYP